MSAEYMAATSAFTKRAYEAQLAHIYRIQNKQIRDLVVAGLILHDWGKLWFLFDDASGKIGEPDWYPKAWGTKANWKWMGGHGAVLYAELIARGIPTDLLFSAASAHFDPYWALE